MRGIEVYFEIEPTRFADGLYEERKEEVQMGLQVFWPESLEEKGCVPLRKGRQWEGQL